MLCMGLCITEHKQKKDFSTCMWLDFSQWLCPKIKTCSWGSPVLTHMTWFALLSSAGLWWLCALVSVHLFVCLYAAPSTALPQSTTLHYPHSTLFVCHTTPSFSEYLSPSRSLYLYLLITGMVGGRGGDSTVVNVLVNYKQGCKFEFFIVLWNTTWQSLY